LSDAAVGLFAVGHPSARELAAPREPRPFRGYESSSAIISTFNHPQIMNLKNSLLFAGGLAVAALPAFANDDADDKFKLMDTNGDGKITRAEHAAGAHAMFGKMDANSDGVVTAEEMAAGHQEKKSGKLKFWDKKDKDEMSASEKIKVIDTNGDGRISRAEHEAGSEKMFTKMDTNDDGVLSKEEFDAGHQGMKKDH
jgi:Ca2+-binding EF-hand superfamily protein